MSGIEIACYVKRTLIKYMPTFYMRNVTSSRLSIIDIRLRMISMSQIVPFIVLFKTSSFPFPNSSYPVLLFRRFWPGFSHVDDADVLNSDVQ